MTDLEIKNALMDLKINKRFANLDYVIVKIGDDYHLRHGQKKMNFEGEEALTKFLKEN